MALNDSEAAVVKGLLATKQHRQSDIAAYYCVNSARIAEINTGMKFPHIKPAPASRLPNIPKRKDRIGKRAIEDRNIKDHCLDRDRVINGIIDSLYSNFEGFQESLKRVQRRYTLNREEKKSIIQTLQQISLQYQLTSQNIEI